MTEKHEDRPVLYLPDSPNVGDSDPKVAGEDPKAAAKSRAHADDIADKVSTGDELSGYEKVAGRGVPEQ